MSIKRPIATNTASWIAGLDPAIHDESQWAMK